MLTNIPICNDLTFLGDLFCQDFSHMYVCSKFSNEPKESALHQLLVCSVPQVPRVANAVTSNIRTDWSGIQESHHLQGFNGLMKIEVF